MKSNRVYSFFGTPAVYKYLGRHQPIMCKSQNRQYNRSLTQIYNVAPLLYCACSSTHPIYLLGRWRRRLSLVCNNQNYAMSLKMLDGYRTSELLYSHLMDENYRAGSGLLAKKIAAVET